MREPLAVVAATAETLCAGHDLDCEGGEEVDPRVAAGGLGPGRLHAKCLRIQSFDQDCPALRERVEHVIEQHDAHAQECSESGDGTHAVGANVGEGGEAGGLLPAVAEDPRDRPGREADRFGDNRRLLAADRVDGAMQVSPGGRGGLEPDPVEARVVDQHAGVKERPPEQRPQSAHGTERAARASVATQADVVNRRWWSRTTTPVPRPPTRQDS